MQSSTTPLEITYLRTTTLKPDPRNPRVHTDKQVRQIAQSIESFGFNVPLLIDDQQKVIAGHGRLLAACKMGWETVPAIKLSHLCDFTSPSKRDIEPAVHIHSKKELPLLRSENSGTSGGQSR
jgi:ParB-like chromosome segregation protein Spo0J